MQQSPFFGLGYFEEEHSLASIEHEAVRLLCIKENKEVLAKLDLLHLADEIKSLVPVQKKRKCARPPCSLEPTRKSCRIAKRPSISMAASGSSTNSSSNTDDSRPSLFDSADDTTDGEDSQRGSLNQGVSRKISGGSTPKYYTSSEGAIYQLLEKDPTPKDLNA